MSDPQVVLHYANQAVPVQRELARKAVTIENAAAVSSSFDPEAARGFAVELPAAWTAADIGIEVSLDDSTFIPLYDDTGTRVVLSGLETAEAGLYLAPPEAWPVGIYKYVRLVSLNTSSGANENQGAERSLTVALLG